MSNALKLETLNSRQTLEQMRDEIVLEYLPLVRLLAHQIYKRLPKVMAMDDLVSSGVIGLLDAIKKYEAGRNIQFKTYASYRIRGAMLDSLRAHDWLPRAVREEIKMLDKAIAELEKRLGFSPDTKAICDYLGWEKTDYNRVLITKSATFKSFEDVFKNDFYGGQPAPNQDPFEELNLKIQRQLIKLAIEKLPVPSRRILQLYYYEELTLLQISKIFRISESRACQILKKAHKSLKSTLESLVD